MTVMEMANKMTVIRRQQVRELKQQIWDPKQVRGMRSKLEEVLRHAERTIKVTLPRK